jgi:FKBP-type peptidyl-prolyl cis-trans isomerase
VHRSNLHDCAHDRVGDGANRRQETCEHGVPDEGDRAGNKNRLRAALLRVHYTGWLTNGKKFDSSVDAGKPFDFTIGNGEVIVGWEEGVTGMRVGGKRQLRIPPALGYGAEGTQDGTIPPNATLIFDIQLLGVQ